MGVPLLFRMDENLNSSALKTGTTLSYLTAANAILNEPFKTGNEGDIAGQTTYKWINQGQIRAVGLIPTSGAGNVACYLFTALEYFTESGFLCSNADAADNIDAEGATDTAN